MKQSEASACIVKKFDNNIIPKNMVCLEVDDVHAAFAKVSQKFYPVDKFVPKIDKHSSIPNIYRNSKTIRVDAFVVIEDEAIIRSSTKNDWNNSINKLKLEFPVILR